MVVQRLQLIDALVASKADYSLRDDDGYTVFHACAQKFAYKDAMPREVAKTVFNALLVSIFHSQHPESMPQEIIAETRSLLELPIFDNKTLADLACSKKCKKERKFNENDCPGFALCDPEALVANAYKEAQEVKDATSLTVEF